MRFLVDGHEVIVDDDLADVVSGHNWRINKGYVVRTETVAGKFRLIYLHRVVMGADSGTVVGNVSGDKLDNRRQNLRFCSMAEALRSRKRSIINQCGFKGVYHEPRDNRRPWRAQIKCDRKKYNLGSFDTPEDAHLAYVEAANRLHGEFARTA